LPPKTGAFHLKGLKRPKVLGKNKIPDI